MGSNGFPPVRIPRPVQARDPLDYDPFRDDCWPRVLAECEEYQRTLKRKRDHRIRGVLVVTTMIALVVWLWIAIPIARDAWQMQNEAQRSPPEVPYVELER